VGVGNFSIGVDIGADVYEGTFIDLRIRGCATGLRVNVSGEGANQNVFLNTDVQYTTVDGILVGATGVTGGSVNEFYGGVIQNFDGNAGIRVVSPATLVHFDGFWIEGNIGATYALDFTSGSQFSLTDTYFSSDAGGLRIGANGCTLSCLRHFGGAAATVALSGDDNTLTGMGDFTITDTGARNYIAYGKVVASGLTLADGKSLEWSDVNLYRGAANVLKTDDSLAVATGLNVGTATGATAGQIKTSAAIFGGGALSLSGQTTTLMTQNYVAQADEATNNLFAEGGEGGFFLLTSNAGWYCLGGCDPVSHTVTLISNPSGEYAITDTDGKVCLLVSTGNLTIKNRSGGVLLSSVHRLTGG